MTAQIRPLHASAPETPTLPLPWFTKALRAAEAKGYNDGEQAGFTTGWRWGTVCGFVPGLLVGMLAVIAAFGLGWSA